jgi:hypothetical protein
MNFDEANGGPANCSLGQHLFSFWEKPGGGEKKRREITPLIVDT